MDGMTLEQLAELICGDGDRFPQYRTGGQLTRFFQNVGFSNYRHDGTTRKWWVLNVLQQLTDRNLSAVILRLADPKEYAGNREQVAQAITRLNELLNLEGKQVILDGVAPKITSITPVFHPKTERELTQLDPPEFLRLHLDPNLAEILSARWRETQLCHNAKAHLSSLIQMGALLEAMLLSALTRYPENANRSLKAPKDNATGKVKRIPDWTLSAMIDVALDLGWIDLDVQKFSHALREFRNAVHPYQQLACGIYPDEDTCKISWLVVQAASNDLARLLGKTNP